MSLAVDKGTHLHFGVFSLHFCNKYLVTDSGMEEKLGQVNELRVSDISNEVSNKHLVVCCASDLNASASSSQEASSSR